MLLNGWATIVVVGRLRVNSLITHHTKTFQSDNTVLSSYSCLQSIYHSARYLPCQVALQLLGLLSGINKPIIQQLTNKIQITANTENCLCCYACIPLSKKFRFRCWSFFWQLSAQKPETPVYRGWHLRLVMSMLKPTTSITQFLFHEHHVFCSSLPYQ
jgi:hypothetical protein